LRAKTRALIRLGTVAFFSLRGVSGCIVEPATLSVVTGGAPRHWVWWISPWAQTLWFGTAVAAALLRLILASGLALVTAAVDASMYGSKICQSCSISSAKVRLAIVLKAWSLCGVVCRVGVNAAPVYVCTSVFEYVSEHACCPVFFALLEL